jgi:4-amino-4-deoxy-L-arabinose transferase-like glycosyltransferase
MSSRDRASLAALLLLALGLRLAFFSGLQVGDDIVYSKIAAQRAAGTFQVTNVHEARFGFLLPITLSYAVFGVGELPLVLYNLLCSTGLVGAIWLLARRFGGPLAAGVAGTLAAVHPNLVFFATECHTDTPVAFWQALAALAWLKATSSEKPARWLAGCGLLVGWAWLHKEHAVFLLPLFAVHGLLLRKPWSWFLPAALPPLGVLAMESLLYWIFASDALHRFKLVQSLHVGHYMVGRYAGSPELWDRLFLELPRRLFFPQRPPNFEWLLNLLGLIGAVVGSVRNAPGARFLTGWWLSLQLAYAFWPSSLRPYLPAFYLFDWTLPPLLGPLAATAGLELARRRPPAVAAALAGLALCCLATSRELLERGRKFSAGGKEAHAWLEREKPAAVFADDKTIEVLDFLDGHRPRRDYVTLERIEITLEAVVLDDFVILVDRFWTEPKQWWTRHVPDEVLNPPPTWKKLHESARIIVYRLPIR